MDPQKRTTKQKTHQQLLQNQSQKTNIPIDSEQCQNTS